MNKRKYDEIVKYISKMELTSKERKIILDYFPICTDDFKIIPDVGELFINNSREKILQIDNDILSKFNIDLISREESDFRYKDIINEIDQIEIEQAGSIEDLKSLIKTILCEYNLDISIYSKQFNYIIEKIIEDGSIDYKDYFIVETLISTLGNSYNKYKCTKRGYKFLLESFNEYIFYPLIGRNPLKTIVSPSNDLLIFDLDGTVFDTDFLRNKRRYFQDISNDEIQSINFIKGFNDLFLDNLDNDWNLYKNNILFVSSNRESFSRKILRLKLPKLTHYNLISTSAKKEKIREYLLNSYFNNIYAFGDDEKDANVYSELEIPFYIVNNYYGYDYPLEIVKGIANSNKNNFRNKYLYDKKTINFDSIYFDDIVLY